MKLIPKKLYKTSGALSHPYWVEVAKVKYGGSPRAESRIGKDFIFDGDWDLEDQQPINQYLDNFIYTKTAKQLLQEGLPYYETEQYQEMKQIIQHRDYKNWRARSCKTEEDIQAYFNSLHNIYSDINKSGFKTQRDLGNKGKLDEICVFIDRNGEIHKQQGSGQHRLAIAKMLNVSTIPVTIRGVHRAWGVRAYKENNKDIITAINHKIEKEIAVKNGK
ncbi:hypothetical protein HNR44_002408 [Geomicrobium halophilum]|uniref:ParB-like nuclease domain-containing protein n=1 Tax=Geomicrobium halophilum TaxID=549000 RepID=A0A841Q050_9BACL|nr:hypothetical protein [Geomicrobium halophilum]MBB6450425.1 hypothetical protein [Geomicrobium halophilum]